jgi:hypothetical protein
LTKKDLVREQLQQRERLQQEEKGSYSLHFCSASLPPAPSKEPARFGLYQQAVQFVRRTQQQGHAAWTIQQGRTGRTAHQQPDCELAEECELRILMKAEILPQICARKLPD